MCGEIVQDGNDFSPFELFDAQHSNLGVNDIIVLLAVSGGTFELTSLESGTSWNTLLISLNSSFGEPFDEKISKGQVG